MTNGSPYDDDAPQEAQMAEILPPMDASAVLDSLRDMPIADAQTLYRAVVLYREIAPALDAALNEFLHARGPSEADENLAFWGVHIMAAARDTSAFTRVLRLLCLDEDDFDAFWGDTGSSNVGAILASTFNGDVDALLSFIEAPASDPFAGWEALLALVFLTWDKRIDRAITTAFLHRCFDDRMFAESDPRWYAWVVATGLMGMAELEPAVRTVFEAPLIDVDMCELHHWQSLVKDAETRPDDIARFAAENIGYLTDIYAALRGNPTPPDEEEEDEIEDWSDRAHEPVRNPLRHVGRNDPCPCGSGKKFKKCCLAAA